MNAKILISITQVILNLQFLIPISGTKGSKEQASPCSSEVFFQHFNKRKATANCDTDVYNRLIKSPVEEARPVKTCSHQLIKQASANSETKSCQTLPSDQEKSFSEKKKSSESMKVPDLTQVKDMAPDITQVTVQNVIGNENLYNDNLPQVGSRNVNGVSVDHISSKSNGVRIQEKDSAEQSYNKIRESRDGRSKSQSHVGKHLNNSYTDPYLDQSCYQHPAVNYYANSIYLGQDIPVFVPSTDNFYALESSGGNTSTTPYLDYYYTRPNNHEPAIAYHGKILSPLIFAV